MNSLLTSEHWTPRLLSLLRIVLSYILLFNGWERLRENPPITFGSAMDTAGTLLFWIEMIFAVMLLVGLFTRVAALILFFEATLKYGLYSFVYGRFPPYIFDDRLLLVCFVLLFIASAGSGSWAVDAPRDARMKSLRH